MLEMKYLKTLIFPRALKKLQISVNFSFLSYVEYFSVSIVKKIKFIVRDKQLYRIKEKKEIKVKKNISSIVCEVIETLFFFVKHILNLKYAKQ